MEGPDTSKCLELGYLHMMAIIELGYLSMTVTILVLTVCGCFSSQLTNSNESFSIYIWSFCLKARRREKPCSLPVNVSHY